MLSGKVQNAARRSRKERNKNRIYSSKDSVEVRDLETITTEASALSVISQSEPSKSNQKFDSSVSENMRNDASIGCNNFISSPCKPTNGPSSEETTAQSIQEDSVASSIKGSCHTFLVEYQLLNSVTENQTMSPGLGTVKIML